MVVSNLRLFLAAAGRVLAARHALRGHGLWLRILHRGGDLNCFNAFEGWDGFSGSDAPPVTALRG